MSTPGTNTGPIDPAQTASGPRTATGAWHYLTRSIYVHLPTYLGRCKELRHQMRRLGR